jgi:hypothetical protein
MSIECKAPAGLVPVERRWPKALAALFRRIRPGTGFRKAGSSKEARR